MRMMNMTLRMPSILETKKTWMMAVAVGTRYRLKEVEKMSKDEYQCNRQTCVDCGRAVVHAKRATQICLDCLVARIALAVPPKRRQRFLTGLVVPPVANGNNRVI